MTRLLEEFVPKILKWCVVLVCIQCNISLAVNLLNPKGYN